MASADVSDGLRRRGAAASVPPLVAARAADGNGSAATCLAPGASSETPAVVDSGPLPWPLQFPASTARRFGENPFIRRDRPPCLRQYIKFVFGVFVAPIRIFLVVMTLVGGLATGLLFLAGVSDAALQKPLKTQTRQLISRLIRIFSRAILFFVGLYKIDERRLADETAEMAELDGAPYMLVSNHVSYLDITYHFARDAVAFVAKIEVRRLPIIGRIAAVAQCIFTSRAYVPPSLGGSPVATGHSSRDVSNQASSVNDPHAAVGPGLSPGVRLADGNGSVADEHAGGASSKIARRLQQRGFPPTLLFPEGTTSNNCALLRFRTGAFIHGAPVKPVLLQWGVYDVDPAYVAISKSALLRLLCEPRIYLRVTRLPMYYPSDAEKADPRLFAENVRQLMARQLGVPCAPFSLADRRRRQMSTERANFDELDVSTSPTT
ncbi:hypothetical protein BU14_0216s0018 [Porphyra umbilicalis]|uniref:Phospholipid/glycerol acyltransferase domain-containing protein n=1 Tax=Porphyra umbilicalis TaxID=2786 RepID=A0A1X6P503_PORUM|nr:hypothetical protein BU14_0216s0018 [Porphyra umbilicalis]|eukprot:OSX75927.1 hypothetical protein BU14_0216s0018 [Porphyra umbilicalis]